jgi:CheY-like chemotaxis protein
VRAFRTGNAKKPLANSTTRKQINVLIVDDEESQRTPLAAMLDAWGYRVETAGDGQEALEKLATFSVNVIVTDLMMPRMDGFVLLKRVGADG